MTVPGPRSAAWTRGARGLRLRGARLSAWTFAASIVLGGALAGLIALATTSVPIVSGAPTTDPFFGLANACVSDALGTRRLGFTVAPGGARIAGFDAERVAICEGSGGVATVLNAEALGVGQLKGLAFDGLGGLWLSGDSEGSRLVRWTKAGGVKEVGTLRTAAMAGWRGGAVVLEADGRLTSFDAMGAPLVSELLEPSPQRVHQLLSSPDGEHVALIADGGALVLEAETLRVVRSEAPCEVEGAAFGMKPASLLLVCGPSESWALELDVVTGERTSAALPRPMPVTILREPRLSVQSCDNLPCSQRVD